MRGLVYLRTENYPKAIEDFTTAIKLEPSEPVSYSNRAIAYEALGETAKAELDLKISAELEKQQKP